MDEQFWGVAIGTDPNGDEKHFIVYCKRRGFAVEAPSLRTYATLQELTEQNVAAQIALLHRVKVIRFERVTDH
jgi:hypothetical protein